MSLDQTYVRAALATGGLIALVVAGVTVTVGQVSGVEASRLLESALPTVRFLSSSVITAAATTLALLLTLISFGRNVDTKLDKAFFRHVRHTARLAVTAFVAATVVLTSIVIPFGEGSGLSMTAYRVLYYVFVAGAAILSGALVAVVVSLYRTIDGLIETFWFDDSPYAADEDQE